MSQPSSQPTLHLSLFGAATPGAPVIRYRQCTFGRRLKRSKKTRTLSFLPRLATVLFLTSWAFSEAWPQEPKQVAELGRVYASKKNDEGDFTNRAPLF